jgi:DNA polymerase-3 subunit epsilon/ATP-dependent DNA helicase DinG
LEGDDIRVLAQGVDGAPRALMDDFLANPRSLLLGTSSFWEGVDLAGDALTVLVLARLPFDVPSDPVFAARSEGYEEPFRDYAVPQAILRFRQGFGRLIRTGTDRGVVAVLDRRLTARSYGALFLKSLPDCTVTRPQLNELPALVTGWLAALPED